LRWAVQVAEVGRVAAAVAHAVVIQVIGIRPLKPTCLDRRCVPKRLVRVLATRPMTIMAAIPLKRSPLVRRPPPSATTLRRTARLSRRRLRGSEGERSDSDARTDRTNRRVAHGPSP
jgi:hypothetical protein